MVAQISLMMKTPPLNKPLPKKFPMKRYIFHSLLALILASITACRDDEQKAPVVLNADMVKAGPDFTDTRDNYTYKTLQVGNQLWMAENLRYAPPGYSLDGAYTWGEPNVDKSKIKPDDESIIAIIRKVASDPQYGGWLIANDPFPPLKFGAQVLSWLKQVERGRMTVKEIIEQYIPQMHKEMHMVIEKELLNIIELPEVKARIGKASHEKAEAKNGGYVAKYGFLYTLEAAKQAVPEGWRLPTDEDWLHLEQSLGLSQSEAQGFETWRGKGLAPLMNQGGASGFNALHAGGKAYTADNAQYYTNLDRAWYFWTATQFTQNDSIPVATIRIANKYTDKVWRGTSRLTTPRGIPVTYTVRCVRDLQ